MAIMGTKSSTRWFFPTVMGALVVWGTLVAIGVYLGPEFWSTEDEAPQALVQPFDYRKPVIVITFMLLFLGVWAFALRSRERRLARQQQVDSAAAKAAASGSRESSAT
jgi:cbb3-type cytochrome oxidase subunit 3